jgi:hypothetical protein
MFCRISCVLAAGLSISSARSAPLDIDFGVDQGTKDIIQGLPEHLRKQLEQAVRDLLPELDKHVATYIKDIDKVLHNNIADGINALQCSSTGVIENAKSTLAASLAALFFQDGDKIITPPGRLIPLSQVHQDLACGRAGSRGWRAA